MARYRSVRVCPICSKNNSADANRCAICGEDMARVPLREIAAGGGQRRLSFGVPERATLGFFAGALVGYLLALAPYADYASGPSTLYLALTESSGMVLIVIVGVVGGVLAALTARPDVPGLQLTSTAGSRRPCPYCAEMIQSQAVICRYCDRPV